MKNVINSLQAIIILMFFIFYLDVEFKRDKQNICHNVVTLVYKVPFEKLFAW